MSAGRVVISMTSARVARGKRNGGILNVGVCPARMLRTHDGVPEALFLSPCSCSDLGVGCFAVSARDAGFHSSIIALLVLRLVSAQRYQDYNGGACTLSSSYRASCSMSSVSRGKVDSIRASVLYKHALKGLGFFVLSPPPPPPSKALPKVTYKEPCFTKRPCRCYARP